GGAGGGLAGGAPPRPPRPAAWLGGVGPVGTLPAAPVAAAAGPDGSDSPGPRRSGGRAGSDAPCRACEVSDQGTRHAVATRAGDTWFGAGRYARPAGSGRGLQRQPGPPAVPGRTRPGFPGLRGRCPAPSLARIHLAD